MSETTKAVAILRAAYPGQDFPDDSVRLYVRMLAGEPEADVVRAVERLIRRSPWLPKVADILREVAEERLQLPSAEEAWSLIVDLEAPPLPKAVRDAMSAAGGRWTIMHSENPTATRAQFVKDYTARRERRVLEQMGAAPVRELEAAVRAELPVSDKLTPRPVWARWLRRQELLMDGVRPDDPTDEEKADAIRVLRFAGLTDHVGPLHEEAQRIMDEASA